MRAAAAPWRVGVDVGGTFADCVGIAPSGEVRRIKLMTDGWRRAAVTGASGRSVGLAGLPEWCLGALPGALARSSAGQQLRVESAARGGTVAMDAQVQPCAWLELASGEEAPVWGCRLLMGIPPAAPLPGLELKLSTTRGTNALLQGTGRGVGIVVTRGLEGTVEIGTQQRLGIFDLAPRKPPLLASRIVGVRGRVAADGSEIEPLDCESLEECARALQEAGVRHVAVALMHSWRNPAHEREVGAQLRRFGFESVALSCELAPLPRLVPRAQVALVEACLHEPVQAYLKQVRAQLGGESAGSAQLRVGTSAGGVVPAALYRAKDSLLSGPAAGCRGAVRAMRAAGVARAVTLDMGGTSTDAARVDEHGAAMRFESTIAGTAIATPSVDVHSIAAGGGSMCVATASGLFVGPRSAGADPGPACYGKGGALALTDVNLLLGRLWSANSALPLDAAASRAAALAQAKASGRQLRPMLEGFLEVANEHMAAAVRAVSTAAGHDPRTHTLVAFGGAGGQHACAVAERLGMERVLVVGHAGFISAQGVLASRAERACEAPLMLPLGDGTALHRALDAAAERSAGLLHKDMVAERRSGRDSRVRVARAVAVLRARGRTGTVVVDVAHGQAPAELAASARRAFSERLQALGDPAFHEEPEVDSVRVVCEEAEALEIPGASSAAEPGGANAAPRKPLGWSLSADGSEQRPVHAWDACNAPGGVAGPALLVDEGATVVVEEGWVATAAPGEGLWMRRSASGARARVGSAEARAAERTAVDLEVAAARFVGIAAWMGTCLERAAHSVNVKERLDFSCGVLDPHARLVANAPHIPVHLGALGACVRSMLKCVGLGPGMVALTNDPRHGGSHLPDVTVARAVHARDGSLLGYVAARAHHAEVGGKVPGSMPPDAGSLEEEGVLIPPCIVAQNGALNEALAREVLGRGPYPSRDPESNVADIRAAVAAIDAGAAELVRLAEERGVAATLQAMAALLERSAAHTRALAVRLSGGAPYRAEARLDDGTAFGVALLPRADGTMLVEIRTAGVHPRCFNAPLSVTRSAVLYVLRVLAAHSAEPPLDDHVAPLNEGFLLPVELRVTHGFLNAFAEGSDKATSATGATCAAVMPPVFAGNTESSQRLVDTLLVAVGAAAQSQGTMNNLVFGNAGFSVYETIGGGAGACPGHEGASGVHVHMSNTRLTDPETLELRHPVRLEVLQVRAGSGGAGRWPGGNGTIRRIRMLEPVSVSFIGQHRVEVPTGLQGGGPGALGEQFVVRVDGRVEPMPGSFTAQLAAGDAVEIRTPGGGGCGRKRGQACPG